MSSINNIDQADSVLLAKAKVTAVKYEKYCKKHETEKVNQKVLFVQKCVRSLDDVLGRAWNTIMPRCFRGASTPYEQLLRDIKRMPAKMDIQNLPFSQLSVNEAVIRSRIKLIVTYTQRSLPETLEKINNSQQINSLRNKNAQILPMKMTDRPSCDVEAKIKELLQSLGANQALQDQVFILWKGLFQQIVVIGHLDLTDCNLCHKTLLIVQEREDYEQLIKKLSGKEVQQHWDQSSLNKLSQQSTGIQKDPSQ